MPDQLVITDALSIPRSELVFRFARSGGRGGQNVNKVETKVELLFDVEHSPSLSEAQRSTIRERLRARIDPEGLLRVVSQQSRSQWQNREIAELKLVELLKNALKPRKKRVRTKVPTAAKEKRLGEKRRRGERKRTRTERFTPD
jgi:ribosome-associated protein